jgi:hypothetical protein
VTCSEAVIVSYQIAFDLHEKPFFIQLDGAHAMPKQLKEWLEERVAGGEGWTVVND